MPRKGENIYKRKDGRWEARYVKGKDQNGKTLYGYVYSHSYRDVRNKRAAVLVERGTILENSQKSDNIELFTETANKWLDLKKPTLKKPSFNKYLNIMQSYIYPSFVGLSLEQVTNDFVQNYCTDLLMTGGKKKQGLSPKTVADILSVIRNILHYAKMNGQKISCDTSFVKVKQKAKELRILSPNEQNLLSDYLLSHPGHGNIGILISLFTGMRLGEVCALRWEDVSLKEKTIHVHQTMQRIQVNEEDSRKTKVVITSPKSECSVRTIPIPGDLAEFLRIYQRTNHGYVLTNSSEQYIEPRTLQNRFKAVLKLTAIKDANFHALRHTFATRCVELGFDIKSLSEILGHATVNITLNRYVHPSMEIKSRNMQLLSVLFTVSKNRQAAC